MDIEKFDKLPIKESMRGTWRRYGYDVDHYDNGIQNYKIVGRYIENYLKKSVGKNFDKVKKHILEHMKYYNLSNASKNIVPAKRQNKVFRNSIWQTNACVSFHTPESIPRKRLVPSEPEK